MMGSTPKVTHVPAANAAMMNLSKLDLVAHGRKGPKQSAEAGAELLRRADNAERRKKQAA